MNGIQEVGGSIPPSSTILSLANKRLVISSAGAGWPPGSRSAAFKKPLQSLFLLLRQRDFLVLNCTAPYASCTAQSFLRRGAVMKNSTAAIT